MHNIDITETSQTDRQTDARTDARTTSKHQKCLYGADLELIIRNRLEDNIDYLLE